MRTIPHPSSLAVLLLGLALPACGGSTQPDPLGIAKRVDGWLRGDLHVHTSVEGGSEDLATVLALAGCLESDEFLYLNPDYLGHGLDYLAITDHDSVAALSDPAWTSDRLILVGGEEWSGNGHANCLGIRELVLKDPGGDGKTQEDVDAAIAATHVQGGIFSINHPMLLDNPFAWDPREIDAVEVWNAGFGLGDPALTAEALADWEAEHSSANPFTRRAVQTQGRLCSGQNLVLYEALLSRGIHVPVVGGSDRHTVLLPGFPTTWVKAASADQAGVIQGFRDRHTFVTRNPAAAQVLLEIRQGGQTYGLGDRVPVAGGGVEIEIQVRVGRGNGARVQLFAGPAVKSDEELQSAPLGQRVLDLEVEGADFSAEVPLQVRPGDWVYPVVLDPLVRPGLATEQAAKARAIAAEVAKTAAEDYTGLATIMLDYFDPDVLLDSSLCNIRDWEPDKPQCQPEDSEGMATFFMPDWLDRVINVTVENDQITEWAMAAVGSAILFVE
jgi:hypothetical protein